MTDLFLFDLFFTAHLGFFLPFSFQRFRSSANLSVDGLDIIRQVDAKYPALLFKMQLSAYMQKIYGIVRDNVKKELTPLLSLYIEVRDCLRVFHFSA